MSPGTGQVERRAPTLAGVDRGEGPAVVLLHGQPGTSADWSAVVPLLADRFRVLAPDRPGYGRTAGPAAGFAGNAEAVLAHLDRAGVGRAVVAGHSWGGGVALRLAALAPDRVAGLVLAASVGADTPTPLDRVLALPPLGDLLVAAALVGTGRALSVPAVRRRLRGRLPPARSTALEALLRAGDGGRRSSPAWRSFAVEQRAFVAEAAGLAAGLPGIACPAEVVVGAADRVVTPVAARRLAAAIPAARLVELPGVGHLLPHDAPHALARAVTGAARRAGLLGAG
ncbi:MAG TPA: alpha/beta hydrolase [Acidimicrobiales bacterium]|nr:alpha/beta hydrolase [Acidimicrobiales bacterium]